MLSLGPGEKSVIHKSLTKGASKALVRPWSVRFPAVRAAVRQHHSLWSEGTGRWSAAMAVVDRLGSSARRAPSTGSLDTDLLGLRAIGRLRRAACEKPLITTAFGLEGSKTSAFPRIPVI